MADRNFRVAVRSVRYKDGFSNFEARLGLGTDNQMSSSTYDLSNPITRNRVVLENMYRSSWIVRQVVGVVADDMTREGAEIHGSADPVDVSRIHKSMSVLDVWASMASGIRWGRLYGGAVAVLVVDGQELSTPLRIETVGKGQFRGLMVFDRWSLQPSGSIVTEPGPEFGKPVSYRVIAMNQGEDFLGEIHHTRCLRFEGEELPHFQRMYEMGWGMSVVEPFYDRLVAFDSTTIGMAQMVYKAHLRTLKMKSLRKNIADGGAAFEAAMKNVSLIRRYQSLEGLSLIDSEDELKADSFTFTGLPDVLIQMSQQVAGATGIPVVKLFGMSPAGFATGESDLKSYQDNNKLKQERNLRHAVDKTYRVIWRSTLARDPPDDFNFEFNPIILLSQSEKADVASKVASAVVQVEGAQVILRSTALKELKHSSRMTGIFASISEEEISASLAEEAVPAMPELPTPEKSDHTEAEPRVKKVSSSQSLVSGNFSEPSDFLGSSGSPVSHAQPLSLPSPNLLGFGGLGS